MFRCKTCAAKSDHIASLEAQIKDLRAMALPPRVETSFSNIEANAVLDGIAHTIEIDESDLTPEQKLELEANIREASAILSGNY